MLYRCCRFSLCLLDLGAWSFVDVVVVLILLQDLYGWPDEPFEEMDSTLAVQQVRIGILLINVGASSKD